ncbi:hypothetical protein EYC82_16345 [Halieaceae bacterium IMCC11814]|uniref:Transposase n=1 Tax=Candidatus Marimicrobium litorale TaxID=2518991 RepID=A0ABT3TAQ4_9GAMM|nr:hypothetical protein [Candidatus Marimicrobium litorale]
MLALDSGQAPPPGIISYAVWLYHRFNLSHRDIEDLLAKRRITVRRFAELLPAPRRPIKIQDNQTQRGEWVATP